MCLLSLPRVRHHNAQTEDDNQSDGQEDGIRQALFSRILVHDGVEREVVEDHGRLAFLGIDQSCHPAIDNYAYND